MAMKSYYVYGLFEGLKNQILDNCFYIGKGVKDRMNRHFMDCYLDEEKSHNPYKVRKIKKLKEEKKSLYARKIFSNLSEIEALRKEEILINQIGLNNLTNLTNGGSQPPTFSGEKHPLYNSGKDSPMYGKTHTKSTKEKMSNALSGENHPFYGVEFSEEHKKNISKSNRGEKGSNSKLSRKQAKEIKYLSLYSDKTQTEIGDEYNIDQTMVSNIKNEKQWRHIDPQEPKSF